LQSGRPYLLRVSLREILITFTNCVGHFNKFDVSPFIKARQKDLADLEGRPRRARSEIFPQTSTSSEKVVRRFCPATRRGFLKTNRLMM
jgi:hypothetical protein